MPAVNKKLRNKNKINLVKAEEVEEDEVSTPSDDKKIHLISTQLEKKVNGKEKKGPKVVKPFKTTRGVVYVSHLPHGFYEDELMGYFKQFGKVCRVRVARSNKTARSRGYAFVEFQVPEVAEIAAQAMNNYIMFNQVLKAQYIPPNEQKYNLFRTGVRKIERNGETVFLTPHSKRVKKVIGAHNREKTPEEISIKNNTYQQKIQKFNAKLQTMGIEGNFSNVLHSVENLELPKNLENTINLEDNKKLVNNKKSEDNKKLVNNKKPVDAKKKLVDNKKPIDAQKKSVDNKMPIDTKKKQNKRKQLNSSSDAETLKENSNEIKLVSKVVPKNSKITKIEKKKILKPKNNLNSIEKLPKEIKLSPNEKAKNKKTKKNLVKIIPSEDENSPINKKKKKATKITKNIVTAEERQTAMLKKKKFGGIEKKGKKNENKLLNNKMKFAASELMQNVDTKKKMIQTAVDMKKKGKKKV